MTRREIVQAILAAMLLAAIQIWGMWISMVGGASNINGQLISAHEPRMSDR
jgi:hypothetical protein